MAAVGKAASLPPDAYLNFQSIDSPPVSAKKPHPANGSPPRSPIKPAVIDYYCPPPEDVLNRIREATSDRFGPPPDKLEAGSGVFQPPPPKPKSGGSHPSSPQQKPAGSHPASPKPKSGGSHPASPNQKPAAGSLPLSPKQKPVGAHPPSPKQDNLNCQLPPEVLPMVLEPCVKKYRPKVHTASISARPQSVDLFSSRRAQPHQAFSVRLFLAEESSIAPYLPDQPHRLPFAAQLVSSNG